MKTLVALLLSLALSVPAFALNGSGNVSNVVGLSSGGPTPVVTSYYGIPAGASVFHITCGDAGNNLTANNYYPCYTKQAAYQVTALKTAHCFNITSSQNASSQWQFVTDSAAFAFNASSLTSGAWEGGASGKFNRMQNGASNVWTTQPGGIDFPASRFVGIQQNATASLGVHADCFEN